MRYDQFSHFVRFGDCKSVVFTSQQSVFSAQQQRADWLLKSAPSVPGFRAQNAAFYSNSHFDRVQCWVRVRGCAYLLPGMGAVLNGWNMGAVLEGARWRVSLQFARHACSAERERVSEYTFQLTGSAERVRVLPFARQGCSAEPLSVCACHLPGVDAGLGGCA